MKRINAKFNGPCSGWNKSCKGVKIAETVMWARGQGVWHPGCGPTGVDPAGDREYAKGLQDYENMKWARLVGGEAAVIDYERNIPEDY